MPTHNGYKLSMCILYSSLKLPVPLCIPILAVSIVSLSAPTYSFLILSWFLQLREHSKILYNYVDSMTCHVKHFLPFTFEQAPRLISETLGHFSLSACRKRLPTSRHVFPYSSINANHNFSYYKNFSEQ